MRRPGAPACCSATASARRSACWPGSTPTIGPIVAHGAVETLNAAYRAAGVALPPTRRIDELPRAELKRAIALAPPAVQDSVWARRLGDDASDAFASGWMRLRGARRRQGVDRGFVLSDHADWPGLQRAITATGAERVIVTHGYEAVMVRWLQQQGLQAQSFATAYGDDAIEAAATQPPSRHRRRHEGLRRAVQRARREHVHRAQGRRDAALLRASAGGRRGVGRVLSGRRQAAPDRAHRGDGGRRMRGRSHRRLAVRRLLPGGGRPGRDHRARAAAARRR